MAIKSLKGFIRESSIRKEVDRWDISDCESYIAAHDEAHNDKNSRKVCIVSQMLNIKRAVRTTGSNEIKKFLKDIPTDILVKYAPKQCQDPNDKKLKSHQKNTGVYLWKNGYLPEKILGVGANGVTWKCGNKALKVTCDKLGVHAVKEEKKDIQTVSRIIRTSLSYKAKSKPSKYLVITDSKDEDKTQKNRAIFESDLADKGDLAHYASTQQIDIEKILKNAKQALKGLKIIHDAGWSHNDVKPDNLLVYEKQAKKLTNTSFADGKDKSKNFDIQVKIADFGGMTPCDNTPFSKIFMNSKFCAPDAYKLTYDAVDRRDTYSLGAVLLFMLLGGDSSKNYHKVAKYLETHIIDNFLKEYGLDNLYPENPASKKKLEKLLYVIQQMVQSDYKKRLTIQNALVQIKAI